MSDKTVSKPYQILASACEYTHEEKRSLFSAILRPVSSRGQAMAELEEIRKSWPGASHYCWAYILGDTEQPQAQAFSDNGEPAGTAGKPILNVLGHRQAGNCLAVVVRVFGGVKLGAGGLVRAYSAAVSQALDSACWQMVTPTAEVLIHTSFAQEERIRHLLSLSGLEPSASDYSDQVSLSVAVPEGELAELRERISEATSGQAQLQLLPEQ